MKFFKRIFSGKEHSDTIPSKDPKIPLDVKLVKNDIGQSINARNINGSIVFQYHEEKYFNNPNVNQIIKDNISMLRISRFFSEYDTISATLIFAKNLLEGEYFSGSKEVKSQALAWCARLLSLTKASKATECLSHAKLLGDCPEIKIAEAFLKEDQKNALSILAELDSPMSKSAALRIVANSEGASKALTWINNAGIDVNELDIEGKHLLLTLYFQLEYWEQAQEVLNFISEDDMREMPILFHWVAMTYLIIIVPNELRSDVLFQVPFNAKSFPLAADANAIETRRKALHYFIKATEAARNLNLPKTTLLDEEYALWIQLRDPDESNLGLQKLKEKLRNSKSALHLVYLGIQFKIELDWQSVDKEIERQIVLHGGITREAALARFALVFTKENPEEAASYLEKHKIDLVNFINKRTIDILQLEMFSKAGLKDKAKTIMDILIEEGNLKEDELHLLRIISDDEGTYPVEALIKQFEKSESLGDLILLVKELEARGEWESLCSYAKKLFRKTSDIKDAEVLVKALAYTHKNQQLVQFIKENKSLLEQSNFLQINYCWALYYEGSLLEARAKLMKLDKSQYNPQYKSLLVNINICLGDWYALTLFISKEWEEREKRDAGELISTAQLALYLDSPHAKDLLFIAADKGKDDANILATAYFLATSAGWENDSSVFQWLDQATLLSDENGPIQKKTLEDLLRLKPEWEDRELETMQQLSRGEIPMFVSAELLNKSLIQVMLFPSMNNLIESDPRRKATIPAFSGMREPKLLNSHELIAIDASVLLTLSFLNMLDRALDTFDKVVVPHSTLAWLFEEKQKVAFHQPSRIRNAHHLQHLLAKGILEHFIPSNLVDNELSSQVGEELAKLITEAKNVSKDGKQGIVVTPYPVHRIASLMNEEADLEEYSNYLSSCKALVEKLKEKGQITNNQAKNAYVYLQLHEKPWSNQPVIQDGAILFLDDTTISYFMHLGFLEKLKALGFRLIANSREIYEANELINYEGILDKIEDAIESIRSALNSRIETGKVVVAKKQNFNEVEKHSLMNHPTAELFNIIEACNTVIVDDRFLNKHSYINNGKMQLTIYTTLDLLDFLVSMGVITTEEMQESRTMLRRAGYSFIPLCEEELKCALDMATVTNNKVIETAELKAIRESILLVGMRTWLQLPKEAKWLFNINKTIIEVLKDQWVLDNDLSIIKARSNWLIQLIDIRAWSHFYGEKFDNNLFINNQGVIVLSLLAPFNASKEIVIEYLNWIEFNVLIPIKEENQELYNWVIQWYQRQIADLTSHYPSEEELL